MSRNKKVLFIKRHDANAKFVTNDIEILRSRYDVRVDSVKIPKDFRIIFTFAVCFFRYIFLIPGCDLIYIWFADYHSLLPVFLGKIFRKKSLICVGGYEATYIPEIEMGVFSNQNFRKRMRRICTSYSLMNCSVILPVDDSLIQNTNTYIHSADGKPDVRDGMKNMLPGIKTPMKTVKLGYDPEIFKCPEGIVKERAVVSAGYIMNKYEFMRKGFDMLEACAKIMNDTVFIFIGLNEEHHKRLEKLGLDNVELYGKVDYDTLVRLYSRAKVYSQLSLFEGMPSSACEAMLCKCIPVGSDVNGIPEIIGEAGVIVHNKKLEEIIPAFKKALDMPDSAGEGARERIMRMFSFGKRKVEILSIAEQYTD